MLMTGDVKFFAVCGLLPLAGVCRPSWVNFSLPSGYTNSSKLSGLLQSCLKCPDAICIRLGLGSIGSSNSALWNSDLTKNLAGLLMGC
ncbi:hypothetical protein PF004_g30036 [Phytophthora fragariae]|uniref:Secreted protein n=2 Tax=Phytophthora fragariae TaxID=53985 RepID=A0A6G0MD44_9STRA|nr:hypothetical protein PF004_g30036 [Phytophthora fragariae]